jgi:hypothetical protein
MAATRAPTTTAAAMTDAPRPRKNRWSKLAVRATAWTAGATAFISALGAFGASAIPVATDQASSPSTPTRQKVIIRRIVKRIVIVDPAAPAPVRVVPSGGSGSVPAAAPAPAPAPAPSTGGS